MKYLYFYKLVLWNISSIKKYNKEVKYYILKDIHIILFKFYPQYQLKRIKLCSIYNFLFFNIYFFILFYLYNSFISFKLLIIFTLFTLLISFIHSFFKFLLFLFTFYSNYSFIFHYYLPLFITILWYCIFFFLFVT